MEFVRGRFSELAAGGDVFDAVASAFFSQEAGSVVSTFARGLGLTDREADQFLARLFAVSSLRASSRQFEMSPFVQHDGLMSHDDYVAVFAKLKTALAPSIHHRDDAAGRHYLWQEIQRLLNQTFYRHFVDGRPQMATHVAVDDHKQHMDTVTKGDDRCGLLIDFFTDDQRRGVPADSLVDAITGVPLSIVWHTPDFPPHKFGEKAIEAAIPSLDLDRVRFYRDRGYGLWQFDNMIMKRRGDVAGTVRRAKLGAIYTYGKDLQDGRLFVRDDGPAELRVSVLDPQHSPDGGTVVDYAWGCNGSVTLLRETGSMASLVPHYNIVLAAPTTTPLVQDDFLTPKSRLCAGIPQVRLEFTQDGVNTGGNRRVNVKLERVSDPEIISPLLSSRVVPITITQGDPGWHMMRRFRITSSVTSRYLVLLRPADRTDVDIQAALAFATGDETAVDADESDRSDDEEEESPDTGASAGKADTRESDAEAEFDRLTKGKLEELDADGSCPYVLTLLAEDDAGICAIESKTPAEEVRSLIRVCAGVRHKKTHPVSTMRKNVKQWLMAAPAERLFIGMDTKGLQAWLKKNKPGLFATLKKQTLSKPQQLRALCSGDNLDTVEDKTAYDAMLRASLMRGLVGRGLQHAREGNRMEVVLATWLQMLDEEQTLFAIKAILQPGLVHAEHKPYFADSCDRIAVIRVGQRLELAGVEIKLRAVRKTQEEEERARDIAKSTVGLRAVSGNFFEIDGGDPKTLAKIVRTQYERLQILHHAAVWRLKRVLLLTGTQKRIIAGYWIKIPREARDGHAKIVDKAYDGCLSWLYNAEVPFPEEEIKRACARHSYVKSLETFNRAVAVWKAVNAMEFPLQRFESFLPMCVARWNFFKGGIDVQSRLLANAHAPIPGGTNSTQARVIVVMLQLLGVATHRVMQICTSKAADGAYHDLKAFRHSASARRPFWQTLGDLSEFLQQRSQGTPANTVTAAVSGAAEATRMTRATVANHGVFESAPGLLAQPSRVWRVSDCTGAPVLQTKRPKCTTCHARTHWMCTGCVQPFCHGLKGERQQQAADDAPKMLDPGYCTELPKTGYKATLPSGGDCDIYTSCWLEAHTKVQSRFALDTAGLANSTQEPALKRARR